LFGEEYTTAAAAAAAATTTTTTTTTNNNNNNITCLNLQKIERLDSRRDRCCYLVQVTSVSQTAFYLIFYLIFLSYEVLRNYYQNMTIIQDFYCCDKLYLRKHRKHEVYNQIMLMTPIFNLGEAFYGC
jgi:hypothetical protein